MSYSFKKVAPTKAQAKAAAMLVLAQCTEGQRGHDCDREVVHQAVAGAIDALGEPVQGKQDVCIEAHGHSGGDWNGGEVTNVREVSFTVKATIVNRPEEPAAPAA